ncbi:MAG: hypothetical protein V7K27_13660 [Nostoc sp.]|uniref:hypothetical protein n=1 Tax=Nostoc sp. TaxID=1180 RepID=UPI002FFB59A4
MGGAQRNPTDYQDVGLRKASNATCYNAGNPRNAVAPQQSNFFATILAMTGYYKTTEIFSEIKYDSYICPVAIAPRGATGQLLAGRRSQLQNLGIIVVSIRKL